ncbi:hypothetical protein G6F64_014895 [Rhizopus arrhizus]|uniref:Uncharacterized protein n=1 Tax=Rhizopus oryzae TaxID=64495 RepID=A0A9P6WSQ3_RHIOR|nr:hypothetical protein G6F64_014895 [Rhizopus arrhizus]
MVRGVAAQHVVQQAAGSLHLAQGTCRAARQRRRQQSRHPGDLAELAARQLSQVDAIAQGARQLLGAKQFTQQRVVKVRGFRQRQHQAVVVDRV